jgi:copper chaperone CopZ
MKKVTKKSVLLILLVSFLGFSHTKSDTNLSIFDGGDKTYIKIWVDGMACPFCAYGLEKSLKKLSGVENLFVDLNNGFILFSAPSENIPSEDTLKKLIKEAGFKARKFEYSDKPFPIKKNN